MASEDSESASSPDVESNLRNRSDANLQKLSQDVGDLWAINGIPRWSYPPTPFEFLRDHVAPSIPCIIQNAILMEKNDSKTPMTLSLDQLVEMAGEDALITVNVTPDGHGDCVRDVFDEDNMVQKMFVKPLEMAMTFGHFRERLRSSLGASSGDKIDLKSYPVVSSELYREDIQRNLFPHEPAVLYFSQQNDCLRQITELSTTIWNKFPPSIQFADIAFGTKLDAVNLWIGNQRSVSSMHKDHYENLFYVASGEKIFTLCPPADVPFLHIGEFPSASFCRIPTADSCVEYQWVVKSNYCSQNDESCNCEIEKVKWIEPDIITPLNQNTQCTYPLTRYVHPITVRVGAGEMLYIPSLWFHRVTQSIETVGVNYWYDMKFDCKWCYFSFLQGMGESIDV
jgi:jumonji domain-containing protein 7